MLFSVSLLALLACEDNFDKAGEELTITPSDEDSGPAVKINPDDPMIPIMIGMMMPSLKMKAIATTIIRILIQTLLKHITTILMKVIRRPL